jgi:F-type H+-transporting ATPase subunit b
MRELLAEPETWVAAAFVIFIGILVWLGVPNMAVNWLDGRSARIKAELDEARRLRQEAEAVLAQYRRKQKEAEQEVEAIIRNARSEAERLAAEARTKVEDFVARRTRMAETRIAQAEAQALADVRSAAADAAVAAAEKVLVETTRGAEGEALIEQGIRDVTAKLKESPTGRG